MDFNTWMSHKKVKKSDLVFTHTLSEPNAELFQQIAAKMAEHNPSFSEGIAFLEKAADLIQMGHTQELWTDSGNFKSWEQTLYKLRYPVSSKRDEQTKTRLEQLPWPSGAKLKFERRGDRAGVELRLFVSSPADLTKIISSLERVQAGMKE